MKKQLTTAVLYTLITAVLLGIVYPLVITGGRPCSVSEAG